MILIAGGKGFIGGNLANVFNRLDPDLYDTADLKDYVDICDVGIAPYDVVVLLAANLGQDMKMFQDNLRISKWAMRQKAHVIFTSSAAVYSAEPVAHTEDEQTAPTTLYGKSKQISEQLIKKGCDNYTILRLANVYGKGEGNGAIDIFKRGGNKIYGDGNDVRDYVSVLVVAEAIKRIALDPAKYNKEIFNISSNTPMTTNEAYEKYATAPFAAEHVPSRGFDIPYSVLDNSKAIAAGLIDED